MRPAGADDSPLGLDKLLPAIEWAGKISATGAAGA